ncbi:LysR family transcriptional regulator [Actinospica sp. MGRD01-02]|uniref:LysR family transcriptional regulator n=1 Tax=Actinospica acidithermotolerans TaxID=2828514 RepID=A0A941EA27_9ACTN|nr:LysR family transcriptional regulator [Actinospica acidithermotolerans]MBR7826778.1 LysR family transcriptional regulator [Actinospica acidithermotolerans]
MDLVKACQVFVHVGEHGSFTAGAAAARVPQPVASRRVAALEEHFGQRLFDRSARRAAVLTTFGRAMLPPAKRLVQLAEALEYHAQEARLRPLTLAVPETCDVRDLAGLDAAAREAGLMLDVRGAGPSQRTELQRSRDVRAAIEAVPPADATWVVPLGLASAAERTTTPFRLSALRPSRAEATYRRIWIQPEDDVPHVRDVLRHSGHRAALLPAQITVAPTLVAAAGAVLRSRDLLLCSARQADDLRLAWRPIAGFPVARGYAMTGDDAVRVREALGAHIARALGAAARNADA